MNAETTTKHVELAKKFHTISDIKKALAFLMKYGFTGQVDQRLHEGTGLTYWIIEVDYKWTDTPYYLANTH